MRRARRYTGRRARRFTGRRARPRLAWLAAAGLLLAGCQDLPAPAVPGSPDAVARLRALREAEVWQPVDPASLDVRRGPEGSRSPGEPLACTFVVPEVRLAGLTPKFPCRTDDGQVLKIKYGPDNMELHGELFGSRLLWLLGFHTDRIEPVRVLCRGCPEDPWHFLQGIDAADPRPPPPLGSVREFALATVETHYGAPIESRPDEGIAWPALLAERSHDLARSRTQRVHREALTLLAGFLGHGDSKAANQTLACAPGGGTPRSCTRPVFYMGDLGSILGRGWRVVTSKVDVEDWASAPVWRDPAACVARFQPHPLGTLSDTAVSEPARAFLAERLAALSEDQIRELFVVAGLDGVGGEVEDPDGTARPPTADEWAAVFRDKRRQIVEHRCPDDDDDDDDDDDEDGDDD